MKMTTLLALAATVVLPLVWTEAQSPTPQPAAGVAPTQAPEQLPAPVNLSPNVAEVVKLAESGVGEDVTLAYVHNSQAPFNLGAEDILYLKDVGISSSVLTAMLTRDTELRGQAPAPAPTFEQKAYASTPPALAPVSVTPQAPPPTEAPPPPAPAYVANPPPDVSYFYTDLAPYGSWVELSGLGWCWQPRVVVVNHGWTPYCDGGHWVFSDAGWYWQSDYSWGWAAFHYGRWYMDPRCGWVWFPDRVWGPAWVTWRTGGEYCGWAPLPPHSSFDVHLGYFYNGVHVGFNFDFGLHANHYTFVALGNFHQHDYGHYRVAATQVNNIYNHTTIINNYVVNNNVIVNRGVPVDRVSAATHTTFEKMTIHDAPPTHGSAMVSSTVAKGVIYRPLLREPAKPVQMVAQKIDQQHPVVQHAGFPPARTETSSLGAHNSTLRGSTTPNLAPRVGQTTSANSISRPVAQNPNTSLQHSVQNGQTTSPNTTARNAGQNQRSYSQYPSGQNYQNPNPYAAPNTRSVQDPRPPNTYRPEKNTYPSGPTGSRAGQGTQNPQVYPKGYYQGGERPLPPNAHQAPTYEGKSANSEPKKTNPER
jgi:hypothetical protein